MWVDRPTYWKQLEATVTRKCVVFHVFKWGPYRFHLEILSLLFHLANRQQKMLLFSHDLLIIIDCFCFSMSRWFSSQLLPIFVILSLFFLAFPSYLPWIAPFYLCIIAWSVNCEDKLRKEDPFEQWWNQTFFFIDYKFTTSDIILDNKPVVRYCHNYASHIQW